MIRKLTVLVMVLTVAACGDKTNNKPAGSTVFHDEKTDDSKTEKTKDKDQSATKDKAGKKDADKAAQKEAEAKAEQKAAAAQAVREKAKREAEAAAAKAAQHRPSVPTPNPIPPPTGPVASSLERPQGDFRSKGEDAGSEARITSCSFAPGRLDDRVQAGNSYLIQDKWMAKEGGFGGYGNVRKSVDAVDHHGNTLNLTLNVQGLNGWYKQRCAYGDKAGQMTANCDFTSSSFGNTPGAGQAKTPKFCSIAWDAKHKITSKVESGTYVMRGGRTVNAVRATRVEEGSLNCDDKDLGHGTIESVTIYSADIPDIEHPSCGNGTQIYYDEITKNSAGAVVNNKKFEIVEMK